MHKFLVTILFAFGVGIAPARALDLDAEKEGLARTYMAACQSYQERSAAPLRDIYAEDAIQVLFPPRGNGRASIGAAAILDADTRNFERMRKFGAAASLSYKLVEREIQGDAVIDRGYFRLTSDSPHGRLEETGRILIIQRKGADGRWHQYFHGNAPATRADYDAADAILTFCTT